MRATTSSTGAERRVGDPSTVPGLPEGLFVAERPPIGAAFVREVAALAERSQDPG